VFRYVSEIRYQSVIDLLLRFFFLQVNKSHQTFELAGGRRLLCLGRSVSPELALRSALERRVDYMPSRVAFGRANRQLLGSVGLATFTGQGKL